MKTEVLILAIVVALAGPTAFSQMAQNEPGREEIAEAYRSKTGGTRVMVPGLEWETWRIKEIRGWKLRFRRINQKRLPGLMILTYKALAKNKGRCAEYRITDAIPLVPTNPQMKPLLTVEPEEGKDCASVSPARSHKL
jgi:hypothetical protein